MCHGLNAVEPLNALLYTKHTKINSVGGGLGQDLFWCFGDIVTLELKWFRVQEFSVTNVLCDSTCACLCVLHMTPALVLSSQSYS